MYLKCRYKTTSSFGRDDGIGFKQVQIFIMLKTHYIRRKQIVFNK